MRYGCLEYILKVERRGKEWAAEGRNSGDVLEERGGAG